MQVSTDDNLKHIDPVFLGPAGVTLPVEGPLLGVWRGRGPHGHRVPGDVEDRYRVHSDNGPGRRRVDRFGRPAADGSVGHVRDAAPLDFGDVFA